MTAADEAAARLRAAINADGPGNCPCDHCADILAVLDERDQQHATIERQRADNRDLHRRILADADEVARCADTYTNPRITVRCDRPTGHDEEAHRADIGGGNFSWHGAA